MQKIAVWRTIGDSYTFVCRRYLALLGVAWFPLAILFAASYWFLRPMMLDWANPTSEGEMLARSTAFARGPALLLTVAGLAVIAVVLIGMTREVMGTPAGFRFVYFRFGRDELRVFGAVLLLLGMFYGALIVVGIFGGVLGGIVVGVLAASGGDAGQLDPATEIGEIVAIIGTCAAVIGTGLLYFAVRLSFLFVPVTLAEKRFGLWRSWELTKGNFWRTLGVATMTSLPFLIIDAAIAWYSAGSYWLTLIHHFGDMHALLDQIRQLQQHIQSQWHAAYYIWVANLFLAPLKYGVVAAASVFAYSQLVPEKVGQ